MATSDPGAPAVHNISFIGLTGAMFSCLAIGLFLYWEAFVTTSWIVSSNNTHSIQTGLWQTCSSVPSRFSDSAWFLASQVLFSSTLFGLVLCFILGVIYLSANKASKNLTLITLAFLAFLASGLALSGLIVLGVMLPPHHSLSWSYGIASLSVVFFLVGGILAVRQIKKSNVRIC